MDEQLGRQHAAAWFHSASTFNEPTLRTKAYANAAIEEFVKLQLKQPEVLSTLLTGGNQGAKLLNTDPYQGLREVIQNADDLKASCVQFGVRTIENRKQLAIVHDGLPVELTHVVPMIYPFYSTKQKSAELKGRFGIGLKTLTQLGERLSVHSAPFHFGSRDDHVARVEEARPIKDFYDPLDDQTLITVDLYQDYSLASLKHWFDDWEPSDLIFLDNVRSISLVDLDEHTVLKKLAIQVAEQPRQVSVMLGKQPSKVTHFTFVIDDARWERFVCKVKVPAGKERAAKATGDFTPIGVALPLDGNARGRLHVALPTKINTNTSFSVDAQFDPSTSREDMIQGPWNHWLTEASGQIIGALAIHLAQQRNTLAWQVVPLGAKTDSSSDWLNKLFREEWVKAIEAFKTCPTLIDGRYSLSQISYCDASIDELLTDADHVEICEAPILPVWMRDPLGRWREVLDTLSVSHSLSLQDVFNHCDADGFSQKPAQWFMEMALRCLESYDEDPMLGTKWVPLANGDRAQAIWDSEADSWLVSHRPENDLALRHTLTEIVHPLLLSPPYAALVDWLSENANYKNELSAQHTLEAFARRYADAPWAAQQKDLLDLRDLFEHVDTKSSTLGYQVGVALLIESFSFESGGQVKQQKSLRSPVEVYLPASIADAQDAWSKAAASTPGIFWASTSYSELFKTKRTKHEGNSVDHLTTSRKRGVKRFLSLLGAETSPRLVAAITGTPPSVLPSHKSARLYLGKAKGGLRRDFTSPDLDAVLQDIRQSAITPTQPQKIKKRRAVSAPRTLLTAADRAIALFRCLDASWPSLESQSRTYAYRENGRTDSSPVPTTWLASLIDSAWFPNLAGSLCIPKTLVVETKVTFAMYEDHTNFADGLHEADANSEFARALCMEVNPPVSGLVAALERERQGNSPDEANLMRLYKALAGHCPQSVATLSQASMIGDMPIASLKGKFGLSRARGLIAPCVTTQRDSKQWFSPRGVFAGKDIFHARQPFVLHDRQLMPLWNALGIRSPDLASCVRELESLAKMEYQPQLDALLIDIYRHMDGVLEKATAADRRSLTTVPLRSSETWSTKRPMYYCSYQSVDSTKITLWEPTCAPDSIPNFLRAASVERLPFAPLPSSNSTLAADDIRLRFQCALRILKTDLAREDERSYTAMAPWDRFDNADVHLHPTGQLIVNATPTGMRPVPLSVHAHADTHRCALHFDDVRLIGRVDFGGAAIASFGSGERVRAIALAWGAAWSASEDCRFTPDITLATEAQDTDLDTLIKERERLGNSGKRKIIKRDSSATRGGNGQINTLPTRRLKPLPEEFTFTTAIEGADESVGSGPRQRGTKPLLPPPTTAPRPNPKPAPESAHRQYSSAELQAKAWAYIEVVLQREDAVLADLQAYRGIGADGALDESTFVEMKSFARGAPSEIMLTEAEFRRAHESTSTFYLVIVSGLEEGYETEIRIYINPTKHFPWTPKGSVSIGGLARGAALVLRQSMD